MTVQERPADADGSIGVVVVTHCARRHLPRCLPPLFRSPLRPRVLVVNSSSGDGTVELAQSLGAETLTVARPAFNHGLTRELARRRLGTDLVVMLTPDAYPLQDDFVERLTAPLRAGSGRRRLWPAGGERGRRPPRAGRPRVQLSAGQPRPQRRRLGRARQLSAFLLERLRRLVERGPGRDRRLQADPGVGGDDRGRRAAGARRADRLRRRGRGRARPRAGSRRRVPPPVRHRLQPPHLRLAAARGRGRRAARPALRRGGAAAGAARGTGRAAADRGPARGAAGSATASGWPGTACRAGWRGG